MSDADDFRRQVFIEWLCTPRRDREPSTQEEFAEQHGIGYTSLNRWKKDRTFLLAWEQYYLQTVGSPERKQNLLDTLYRTGTDADDPRHVAAASKYMELVDGLRPQKLDITVNRPAKDLSDEELDRIAGQFVARERAARENEQAS